MYSIGQVLFVVLSKKGQVYPMQVVEVITKRTLRGEEIQYALRAGADPKETVMLDKVDGEVFATPEEARRTLTQRAASQIQRLVDAAVSKADEWYLRPPRDDAAEAHDVQGQAVSEEAPTAAPQDEQDDDGYTVVLPDGTRAKVRIPAVA